MVAYYLTVYGISSMYVFKYIINLISALGMLRIVNGLISIGATQFNKNTKYAVYVPAAG